MTVHTPFHLDLLIRLYGVLRCDIAMTILTLYLGGSMFRVAEDYKFGYFVDAARWNLPLRYVNVTHLTLFQRRKARPRRPLGTLMARYTSNLQRGM